MLAQADSCGVADQTGASSTAVWLHNVADLPVGVGRARLALHHALTSRPVVAAAFSSGDIGPEAASAVCAAIDTLPGGVPAAMYTEIETLLVDTARDEGTKAVVARSMEIANRFDPDGFAQHEEDARARRFLHLIRQHDGTLKVRGCLDKEAGALVLAVLDPLAAPEPVNEGIRDLRLAEHRYADALVQLCQLATPTLPEVRGERPHMFVTTTLESLQHASRQLHWAPWKAATSSAPARSAESRVTPTSSPSYWAAPVNRLTSAAAPASCPKGCAAR